MSGSVFSVWVIALCSTGDIVAHRQCSPLCWIVQGGRMLFDGIRGNSTLSTINVSSNSLGSETAKVLATVVGNPDSSVVAIDVSANRFRDADLATIRSAIDGNAVLASIDLRANRDITEVGEEHIRAITRVTKKNELALRRSIHGPGAF